MSPTPTRLSWRRTSLNEVRPRRPEQYSVIGHSQISEPMRLNEVRPRRPEQCHPFFTVSAQINVSMKSGLEGRNNELPESCFLGLIIVSMKSGLEGRNNSSTSS